MAGRITNFSFLVGGPLEIEFFPKTPFLGTVKFLAGLAPTLNLTWVPRGPQLPNKFVLPGNPAWGHCRQDSPSPTYHWGVPLPNSGRDGSGPQLGGGIAP